MKNRKRKKSEIWRDYDSMNKFQRSCVHNGWLRYWRVRNGECQWLINDKQNNKDIQKILEKEHERIN